MKPAEIKQQGIIWVLVYTKAKQEVKANENLKRQGFKTLLPLKAEANKSHRLDSLVPIFPRYLFVQINLELGNWTAINSSYGVSSIVMFSDKFTIIPNDIIELIQGKLNWAGIYKENVSKIDYQVGDTIFIKEGGFAGIEAIFLSKKSKDRVRLLLNILNTNVVTEVAMSNIETKEVEKNFKL